MQHAEAGSRRDRRPARGRRARPTRERARRGRAADASAAAEAGDADAAALALRAGAGLEARDSAAHGPAARRRHTTGSTWPGVLVALGADPDALDDRHDTPWLVTGVTGSVAMLEVLLPAHPDLTIRNRYGGVSVIPASERGHVAYVRRVVSTGIDVNHVNDLGWTALLEAVILGDGSRAVPADRPCPARGWRRPAVADADGRSALAHAESRGQTAVAAIVRGAS